MLPAVGPLSHTPFSEVQRACTSDRCHSGNNNLQLPKSRGAWSSAGNGRYWPVLACHSLTDKNRDPNGLQNEENSYHPVTFHTEILQECRIPTILKNNSSSFVEECSLNKPRVSWISRVRRVVVGSSSCRSCEGGTKRVATRMLGRLTVVLSCCCRWRPWTCQLKRASAGCRNSDELNAKNEWMRYVKALSTTGGSIGEALSLIQQKGQVNS